jgi:hypothetical protein
VLSASALARSRALRSWCGSEGDLRHTHQLSERRRTATEIEVADALVALDGSPDVVRAIEWPADVRRINEPGLYSWWVDAAGATMLSEGLGFSVHRGRIYAGLTGATKWPSGKTGKNTLRKRIGSNHIRGRIRGSTFRLTLAVILNDQLPLTFAGPKTLAPGGERILTCWIREHLSVAVYPFLADPLCDLERRVLGLLDPPLNLDGMPATPVRVRLAELRRGVASLGDGLVRRQVI